MLPSLTNLERIQQQIFSIPNQRKESKRREHYCCYLLCQKAGLRITEAINFDLNKKTKKDLYQITKTKGKKKRYAYIPREVIKELKRHNWKPNCTNRFNFYHFLKKIKREMNLPANIELTPHTLRRAFATYHAEAGLPLPLLSKMLGHSSVRTTALYWINTYYPDDDNNDTTAILCGKNWLENKENDPDEPSKSPIINENPPQPERISQLIENLPIVWEANQSLVNILNNYQHQLAKKDKQISELIAEKETLQSDLEDLSEQNNTLLQEKNQIQQDLDEAKQTINHLKQELSSEKEKQNATESNLAQERQSNNNLCQQLQTEQQINHTLRETNTNLTQKLHTYKQNLTNLMNAYQQALKDKERIEKQASYYEAQLKTIAKAFQQWQKLHYYQQLAKQNEFKAQIVQPPPWKASK